MLGAAAVAALFLLVPVQGQPQPRAAPRELPASEATALAYVADLLSLRDGQLDCFADITQCSLSGKPLPERSLSPAAEVTLQDESAPTWTGRIAFTGEQVEAFFSLLDRTMERVPPEAAAVVNVTAPGSALRGHTLPASSGGQLRLPTVLSPRHAGVVFHIQTITRNSAAAAANLFFKNVTLALPGQSFASLTMEAWFRVDPKSRLCFGNALLLLDSCEGLTDEVPDGPVELLCCVPGDCSGFTRAQAVSQGFAIEPLEPIQCYGAQDDALRTTLTPTDAAVAATASTEVTPPDGSDGVSAGTFVAGVLGALGAVLLLSAFGWLLWTGPLRHRRLRQGSGVATPECGRLAHCGLTSERRTESTDPGKMEFTRATASTTTDVSAAQVSWVRLEDPTLQEYHTASPEPAVLTSSVTDSSRLDTATLTKAARFHEAETALERLLLAIQGAAFSDPPHALCGRFLLSGETVQGGQSVVAFARDKVFGMQQYAIKFFLARRDFKTEISLYKQPIFRTCLPHLEYASESTPCDVLGYAAYVYPPFLVTDRGITLTQWLTRPRPPAAILAMAVEVAELLAVLHRAGMVHRDIKPANVLLVTHTQQWRLLDVGIAVHRGHRGAAKCTLAYSAPEAASACREGGTLLVEPSLDVWALGVIAYECLADTTVFPRFSGADAVHRCASGAAPYPWEAAGAPDTWRKARARPLFEACLQRDAQRRPSAFEVGQALRKLDNVTTGAQPDGAACCNVEQCGA